MLTNFTKRILSGQLYTPVRFAFGGSHHEIDYEAIVTKNQKSGKLLATKVITLTPMKWPEELLASLLTSMEPKTSKV